MDDDLDRMDREQLMAAVLRGCVKYRESLERERPDAPVFDGEAE
jgi:hypothetical protein